MRFPFDDPLGEQLGERLARDALGHAGVEERLGEEARIEEVQDRVLDPADVLAHRHPGPRIVRSEGQRGVGEPAEAQEVPARVHEGVHRVRLALSGSTAPRARGLEERVVGRERRATRRLEGHVVGRQDGQLVDRHRDDAVVLAVDDRDRAPPESLPREQPVPEPVVDLRDAACLELEEGRRPALRLVDVEAVQEARVDLGAAPRPRAALEVVRRLDRPHDLEPMDLGEVEVPLVLGRHGHDRPGPVAAEDVVGDVDGHLGAVERIDDVGAGEGASLLGCGRPSLEGGGPLHLALGARPVVEGLDLVSVLGGRQLPQERVLGREDRVRDAEARVRPRREDAELQAVVANELQVELDPLGAPDPVALHGLHALGPVQGIDGVQELVRIGRDPEEPLGQVAALHEVAGPLAGPVREHLLVRQHRLAPGAPVDRRHRPVGETLLEELEEDELCAVDVQRIVALELAPQVVDGAKAAQRGAKLGDPGFRELPGVRAGLDRGVLRRQAEGVEAER
jgi:hypothetical protein